MSAKTRLKLIIIIAAIFAVAMFSGCVGEGSVSDFLGDKGALNQSVTYYANGGVFNQNDGTDLKVIHYRENDYVIGSDTKLSNGNTFNPVYTGWVFDGWYEAEVDSDGKPVYDDNGNLIKTDVVADLSRPITYGEHRYVCAGWVPDVRLTIKLVCEIPVTSSGVTYNSGDVISEINFGTSYAEVSQTTSPRVCDNATFLQYYVDVACATPFVDRTYDRPADGGDAVLYAKYIPGSWAIVRNDNDVFNMLTKTANDEKFYIFNLSENKTIDMSRKKSIQLKDNTFNCQIEGNGFTLENINIDLKTSSPVTEGSSYSFFGQFGSTASIKNLTLKNISVALPIKTNVYSAKLYLICKGADDNAEFENFVIDGANLSIRLADSTVLENIKKISDGVYEDDNWLFGGVAADGESDETDSAFLAKFTGITVTGAQLTAST